MIGIIFVVLLWRFLVAAGLIPEAARFQARTALTGTGYTTSESEVVVNHPAARRAASALFLIGFVGPVTLIGLFGFGFLLPTSDDPEARAAVLIGALIIVAVFERLGLNARIFRRPADFAARRLFGTPSLALWTVLGDHAIGAVTVAPESPLAETALTESPFGDRDLTLLSIERFDGGGLRHIASPQPGETILYGAIADLEDFRTTAEG